MLLRLGEKFTGLFLKFMPNAFVFAILLTLLTAIIAIIWLGTTPVEIITSWYTGFFDLLGFAMQIVLIIITGFSIALSPIVKRGIDKLALFISTPGQVYLLIMLNGILLSMISFGWLAITCVLARELALRVRGLNYPYLVACVYFSVNSWVLGLSSTIPLLLNTENNFLIQAGLLEAEIPISHTLTSSLNLVMILILVCGAPLTMYLLRPASTNGRELSDFAATGMTEESISIEKEAQSMSLPYKAWSDRMNNSSMLQLIIAVMGLAYIIYHFTTRGLDINLNIIIFCFLIVGLFLHRTPMRYVISMKRASSNVSGILFQYPFYAGIMGIMLYTGLGESLGQLMASVATVKTYPFFAYLTGGFVNFAIPSAGGEFAVIGPSLINAVKELATGLPDSQVTGMIARASLSVAYGESLSNMLQPFYLLLLMPVLGKGTTLQARDMMGYLVLPFIIFFIIQSLLVVFWPM